MAESRKFVNQVDMVEQIANHSAAKPIPALNRPRSRKSPAIKTRVIIERAKGRDKTSISKGLGIARNTVTRILEENDVEQQLSVGQSLSVGLIPDAIRVAKHRLSQNSENMAIKVLENTIWPIQGKAGKAGDPGLVLAIQNLMGNVTVQSQANERDSKAIDLQPTSKPSAGDTQATSTPQCNNSTPNTQDNESK